MADEYVDEDEEDLTDVGETATTIAWTEASLYQSGVIQPEAGNRFFKVGCLNVKQGNTLAQMVADIQRFILSSECDIIGLQEAGERYAGLVSAFPDWSFVAPDEAVPTEPGEAPDLVPGVTNIPLMVRKSACSVKDSGAFVGADAKADADDDGVIERLAYPVIWARIVHLATKQTVRVYNTLAPDSGDLDLYGQHTQKILRDVKKVPATMQVVAIGGWEVDYKANGQKIAEWPMRRLGNAKMVANWAYDTANTPETNLKYAGSTELLDHVYHRKADGMNIIGDKLVATTHSDRYGLTVAYELDIKGAVDPDQPVEEPNVDQPTNNRALLTLGTLVLSEPSTLNQARADFEALNDAANGVDIVTLQGTVNPNREDLFDEFLPYSLVRFDATAKNRTSVAYRRARFKRISVSSVLLSDKTYKRPGSKTSALQYACEVVLLDRQTNRYLVVWSIHLPPSSKADGSPAADSARHQIMRDALEQVQAKNEALEKDEALIVGGNLNWPADKKQDKQSVPVILNRANMVSNWSVLGPVATYKGSSMDYLAISDRGWARWVGQAVIPVPNAIHDAVRTTLRVAPKKRVQTGQYSGGVVDEGPSGDATSADYVVTMGSANIKVSLPDNLIRSCAALAAERCDVIGFQEIEHARQQNALAAELNTASGWSLFQLNGAKGAVCIGLRDSKFRLAPTSQMPAGIDNQGSFFMHGPKNNVCPARYVNYVAFVPVATPLVKPIVFMSTHYVSGAWNGHTDNDEGWRQSHWRVHYKKQGDVIARMMAAGLTTVYVGDMNNNRFPAFARTRLIAEHRVDKIGVGVPSGGAKVTPVRGGLIPNASDHGTLWYRCQIKA